MKSETAIKISIQIINTFVALRKIITENGLVFNRLDSLEQNQIKYKTETEVKFTRIFNALEQKELKPKQGIFFDGQVFDAYQFVSDLIRVQTLLFEKTNLATKTLRHKEKQYFK